MEEKRINKMQALNCGREEIERKAFRSISFGCVLVLLCLLL
ncbi:hypothetical protein HMPREF1322_1465 [Porphyromonas gingivalis W50]|nr:hypothetical protein HMPREF1322_1465 [Porphyromonas gingivalis W50]